MTQRVKRTHRIGDRVYRTTFDHYDGDTGVTHYRYYYGTVVKRHPDPRFYVVRFDDESVRAVGRNTIRKVK